MAFGRKRRVGLEFVPGFVDVSEIGIGSLATVYRAREEGTNRRVALKLLNVKDADPRAVESFQREALALSELSSHPNIVTLYRVFAAPDGRPVLVLELCQGSIGERMINGAPIPANEAVSIGIKIAGALETAHRAEILHRDVKPQNILVTEFGEPALADFGVAMLQSSTQTTAGLFDFTTLHAAPELLEGGSTSAATDVYELASTLYQMIAGQSAFRAYDGESPASVILRILRDPVRPLVSPDIPVSVSDLLIWAMSKDLESRPPTAAEFAARLAEIEIQQGWPRTQFLVRDAMAGHYGPSVTRMPDRPPAPVAALPLSAPAPSVPRPSVPLAPLVPAVPAVLPPAVVSPSPGGRAKPALADDGFGPVSYTRRAPAGPSVPAASAASDDQRESASTAGRSVGRAAAGLDQALPSSEFSVPTHSRTGAVADEPPSATSVPLPSFPPASTPLPPRAKRVNQDQGPADSPPTRQARAQHRARPVVAEPSEAAEGHIDRGVAPPTRVRPARIPLFDQLPAAPSTSGPGSDPVSPQPTVPVPSVERAPVAPAHSRPALPPLPPARYTSPTKAEVPVPVSDQTLPPPSSWPLSSPTLVSPDPARGRNPSIDALIDRLPDFAAKVAALDAVRPPEAGQPRSEGAFASPAPSEPAPSKPAPSEPAPSEPAPIEPVQPAAPARAARPAHAAPESGSSLPSVELTRRRADLVPPPAEPPPAPTPRAPTPRAPTPRASAPHVPATQVPDERYPTTRRGPLPPPPRQDLAAPLPPSAPASAASGRSAGLHQSPEQSDEPTATAGPTGPTGSSWWADVNKAREQTYVGRVSELLAEAGAQEAERSPGRPGSDGPTAPSDSQPHPGSQPRPAMPAGPAPNASPASNSQAFHAYPQERTQSEPVAPDASLEAGRETGAVPMWALRQAASQISAAGQFADLGIDPYTLQRKLTVRTGTSSVTVDDAGIRARNGLSRVFIAWIDVHHFEPRGDAGSAVLGVVTGSGWVELGGTRRPMAELQHVHALLDAYRARALGTGR